MRILHIGDDHLGGRAAQQHQDSERRGDRPRDERQYLPVRDLSEDCGGSSGSHSGGEESVRL